MSEKLSQGIINAFNKQQECQFFHPLTCGGNRGDDAHKSYAEEHGGDWGQLIATPDGLKCPVCDYKQSLPPYWKPIDTEKFNPFRKREGKR